MEKATQFSSFFLFFFVACLCLTAIANGQMELEDYCNMKILRSFVLFKCLNCIISGHHSVNTHIFKCLLMVLFSDKLHVYTGSATVLLCAKRQFDVTHTLIQHHVITHLTGERITL